MSTPKLAIWTLFVVGVTYFTALAFVAPRQADARAELDARANAPSVEHLCRAQTATPAP